MHHRVSPSALSDGHILEPPEGSKLSLHWGIAWIRLASRCVCGGIILIANWCSCRRSHPTVGGAIPRQVALDCIEKLAKHEPSSKPEGDSWTTLLYSFYFKLLSWVPALTSYSDRLQLGSRKSILSSLSHFFLKFRVVLSQQERN